MGTIAKGDTSVTPDPHSGLRQRKPADKEVSNAAPDLGTEKPEDGSDKTEINWGKTASGQGMCVIELNLTSCELA